MSLTDLPDLLSKSPFFDSVKLLNVFRIKVRIIRLCRSALAGFSQRMAFHTDQVRKFATCLKEVGASKTEKKFGQLVRH